jgi:drug/metabolite transporter (DMT)-like permease
MTVTSKITWARVIFILAGIAVILSNPGGWDLGVALALATGFASVAAILFARSYLKRDRPLRLGGLGTFVLLVVGWLVIFVVTFYFLYYPESAWRT